MQGGGARQYTVPGGLVLRPGVLNSSWSDPVSDGMEVFVWRPSHWASWMFSVSDVHDVEINGSNATTIKFGIGGFQGARGADHGAEFFVSHVREELDSARE